MKPKLPRVPVPKPTIAHDDKKLGNHNNKCQCTHCENWRSQLDLVEFDVETAIEEDAADE